MRKEDREKIDICKDEFIKLKSHLPTIEIHKLLESMLRKQDGFNRFHLLFAFMELGFDVQSLITSQLAYLTEERKLWSEKFIAVESHERPMVASLYQDADALYQLYTCLDLLFCQNNPPLALLPLDLK